MEGAALRGALRILFLATAFLAAIAHAATVLYVYDELGRLVAEIDPASGTTTYTYDAAGNLLSVQRGSGQFSVVGFEPASAKAGDAVAIFGSGFIANSAQNTVSFNGTTATVTAATTTTLLATVPAGATTGPIAVSNSNGSAVTSQVFTVLIPPAITAVTPRAVNRGQTTQLQIGGSRLATARTVTFAQSGIAAAIVRADSDQLLRVDLSVAASVPFGTYAFSLTNGAGTTASGAVTVTVTQTLLGDAFTVTQPLSAYLPAAVAGAPSGNDMSVTRTAVSVHLPAVELGAPPGNTLSTTPGAVSVYLPIVDAGSPAGNAMSAALVAVSVYLPAVVPGAPPGDAMSVTQPVSVSKP